MRRLLVDPERIAVHASRYVRIGACSQLATGIPVSSQEKMIERGHWKRGREWRKGPDGRRYLDLRAFERWIELGFKGDDDPQKV